MPRTLLFLAAGVLLWGASELAAQGEGDVVLFDHFDAWSWHESPQHPTKFSFADSHLTIFSSAGEAFHSVLPPFGLSFLYTKTSEPRFDAEVRLAFEPKANRQSAGMIAYQDDHNYLLFGVTMREIHRNLLPHIFWVQVTAEGGFSLAKEEKLLWNKELPKSWYLRIRRKGDIWQAFYGTDGKGWEELGTPKQAKFKDPARLGMTAFHASRYIARTKAKFDLFRLTRLEE